MDDKDLESHYAFILIELEVLRMNINNNGIMKKQQAKEVKYVDSEVCQAKIQRIQGIMSWLDYIDVDQDI